MSIIYGISDIWLAAIVSAALYLLFEIGRYFQRRNKRKQEAKNNFKDFISPEITDPNIVPDTPYEESGFPLPQGSWYVYAWERLRDGFMRFFYYNKITVIRLKNEGNADHRAYVIKGIEMNTITWDNCTYNVYQKCLIPIRRNFLMIVKENCTEPVEPGQWETVVDIIATKVNKENYETWDEKTKKTVGKFDTNPRIFFTKMQSRNAELLAITSIPNLQVLYYASIFGVVLGAVLVMQNMGWLPSTMADRISDLKSGIIEVLRVVKT